MQVSHGVLHPSKPYYQLLIRFTLFMTLCLVGAALWAILVHSDNTASVTGSLSGNLANAGAYYDSVQGTAGITEIQYLEHASTLAAAVCTVDAANPWKQLNLYNWPGVKGGWNWLGAYSSGASPDGAATAVASNGAVANVNYWKGGFYCVRRLAAQTAGSTLTVFKENAGDACQQY